MDEKKLKRLEVAIVNQRSKVQADLNAGRFEVAEAGCSLLQDFQKIYDKLAKDMAAPGF